MCSVAPRTTTFHASRFWPPWPPYHATLGSRPLLCVPRLRAYMSGATMPEREALIIQPGIPTQGRVSGSKAGRPLSVAKAYSKIARVPVFYFWSPLFGSS